MATDPGVTGLILSGGGARAAYQAGVLAAIAELLPNRLHNPFPVIVGTSAGAINAVGLASGALRFGEAVHRLAGIWRGMGTAQVYRSDWPGVLRQAGRFIGHSLLGLGNQIPVALLDNAPLGHLLSRELDFSGIGAALSQRCLQAVAVTAFGYESGQAVTFYQSRRRIEAWQRHRRLGMPVRLGVEHLLASAAIPLLFPPVRVGGEYFGDGALRQTAPISPALHLGASRVLVIGVQASAAASDGRLGPTGQLPTLAQIGGHMLHSTFIDSVENDIERLDRLNQLYYQLPDSGQERRLGLRPVEVLVIAPSQPLERIAVGHRHELPAALRPFLRGPGATRTGGGEVLSYLLFESGYCNALFELGYQDAMRKRPALAGFLGLEGRSMGNGPSGAPSSPAAGSGSLVDL